MLLPSPQKTKWEKHFLSTLWSFLYISLYCVPQISSLTHLFQMYKSALSHDSQSLEAILAAAQLLKLLTWWEEMQERLELPPLFLPSPLLQAVGAIALPILGILTDQS